MRLPWRGVTGGLCPADGESPLNLSWALPLTIRSAVFQAGGLLVVIAEVPRSPHLACLVPVIVNAILHEHQIVVDIIAFVNKGSFPRSRLGEKQRGTVLAKWVKRSLQTEAQFAIRNSDFSPEGGAPGQEEGHHRASLGSLRGAAQGGSSLRNVESAGAEREGFSSGQSPVVGGEQYDGNFVEAPHGERPFSGEGVPGDGPDRRPSVQEYPAELSGEERRTELGVVNHDEPSQTDPAHGRLPGVDGREGWEEGEGESEEQWKADAVMHMNLAGDMGDMGRAQ